jgi:RNA polymerase primary sigma factor
MECKSKYVQRVTDKYNRRHVTAFVRKGAEKKYLAPFGLSLRSTPPDNFGNAKGMLSQEDEFQLFTALHYMKWKITRTNHPKAKQRYLDIYIALRNRAITANWPLVLSCVKRHAESVRNGVDRSGLMERGYLSLIHSVDGFDPWRGFRFSTYACNAITRSFFNRVPKRIPVSSIDELEEIAPVRHKDDLQELWIERLQMLMQTDTLTLREKQVLQYRFVQGLKLHQVGDIFELTKERVRQIQFEAIDKLRDALKTDPVLQ